MKKYTLETETLIDLINKKEHMVVMLAPSFLVDFSYPEIINMLRKLGFEHVVEVSAGATETNRQLMNLLESNPGKRYITNPCPTIVQLIKNKYPELIPYLAPIDSPMIATAKMVTKKYPDCRKVYIGPCFAKKIEAHNNPALDILVLTYSEINQVFKKYAIYNQEGDPIYSFDVIGPTTRLYPISGGLAQSSGISRKLTDLEYDVISGSNLVNKTLEEFLERKELKLLDILYCEGGCINGPGIINKDSLEDRRRKIIAYWNQ